MDYLSRRRSLCPVPGRQAPSPEGPETRSALLALSQAQRRAEHERANNDDPGGTEHANHIQLCGGHLWGQLYITEEL